MNEKPKGEKSEQSEQIIHNIAQKFLSSEFNELLGRETIIKNKEGGHIISIHGYVKVDTGEIMVFEYSDYKNQQLENDPNITRVVFVYDIGSSLEEIRTITEKGSVDILKSRWGRITDFNTVGDKKLSSQALSNIQEALEIANTQIKIQHMEFLQKNQNN